jgi:hypothetical protein
LLCGGDVVMRGGGDDVCGSSGGGDDTCCSGGGDDVGSSNGGGDFVEVVALCGVVMVWFGLDGWWWIILDLDLVSEQFADRSFKKGGWC